MKDAAQSKRVWEAQHLGDCLARENELNAEVYDTSKQGAEDREDGVRNQGRSITLEA